MIIDWTDTHRLHEIQIIGRWLLNSHKIDDYYPKSLQKLSTEQIKLVLLLAAMPTPSLENNQDKFTEILMENINDND